MNDDVQRPDQTERPDGNPERPQDSMAESTGDPGSVQDSDIAASSAAPTASRWSGWTAGGRRWMAAGAVGALLVGGVAVGAYAVGAAADSGDGGRGDRSGASGDRHGDGGRDADRDQGRDEVALTGDVLASVEESVEQAYPGSTIDRAETDSDGVYEAHITTADGDEVTVELDESFVVTGIEDS